jgi:ABC-type bacteriocin/lantibiotic exporter with double-glycine peptidase domain
MKAPPPIEAQGLRAYDRVCAFERLQRRRLPVIYCGIALLIVICGLSLMIINLPVWALICLMLAIFFSVMAWFNWQKLTRDYAKNLAFLAELESTYGDELPWLEVEKHLAALEQLKSNLEEEKKRGME